MNETDNTKPQSNASNDEIDIIEVALKVWKERKIIYKTVAVFFALGLIVAFGSKKEYKAECTFILDDNQGGSRASGLLSQFGGLAGIHLSGQEGQGMISPELFPNIVKSTPFILELLESEIEIEKFDTTVTIFTYFNDLEKPSFLGYIKKFTIGLPGTILKTVRKKDNKAFIDSKNGNQEIIKLTKEQEIIIEELNNRININIDEKTGIISFNIELPDPVGAAQLTKFIYHNLTEKLIEYKVNKATENYHFIYEQYLNAKGRYEKVQMELAKFRDQNKNVSSQFFQTEEQKLQNEYQLAFNLYNGLAQQLEQANIKVQEAMPVFQLINKIKLPLKKSKPNKKKIILISCSLGLILGIMVIILRKFSLHIINNYKLSK